MLYHYELYNVDKIFIYVTTFPNQTATPIMLNFQSFRPQQAVHKLTIEECAQDLNADLTVTGVTHESENHMHEHDFLLSNNASDGEDDTNYLPDSQPIIGLLH